MKLTRERILVLLIAVLAGLHVVVMAVQLTKKEPKPKSCTEWRKQTEACESKRIDVVAENVRLKQKMENMVDSPPNSRHAYGCKEVRKGGRWNLALYTHTTNKLYTWWCDGWKGHISPENQVPEANQQRLVCTDERGTRYPHE